MDRRDKDRVTRVLPFRSSNPTAVQRRPDRLREIANGVNEAVALLAQLEQLRALPRVSPKRQA